MRNISYYMLQVRPGLPDVARATQPARRDALRQRPLRWEPELVRPAEDIAAFRARYGQGKRQGIDEARQLVLEALDATPDGAWKPSDAKERARTLLLRAVGELETMPLPK